MLAPVICITIFVVCFLAFSSGTFFDDLFNPGLDKSPKFSGSQLYLLDDDNSVGLDAFNGSTIGCFGDFNNDKYTDVYVILGNGSNTAVNVYLWDNENWQFTNSSAAIADPYIINIAAGDFNYDGKLDLLVQGLNVSSNLIYVKIYFGNLHTLEGPVYEDVEAISQVSVIDINNDLRLDLFGEIAVYDEASNTTQARRVFWINKGNDRTASTLFQVSYDPFGEWPLLVPHSSAFVDINGDCLADRFVVTKDADGNPQYQLLLNAKSQGYVYAPGTTVVPMPLGSGQAAFADFDKDGNTDILIPVCYPAPNCTKVNSLYVYFNKQKPICSLLGKKSSCRSTTDMCSGDPNFHLGVFNATPPDPYFQEVVITLGDHFYFNNAIDRPLTIHVGDYNLDGYPDILIPLIGQTGGSRVELWENVNSDTGRRTFAKVTSDVDDLLNIPNAYAGAFFDLGDDGVLDLFVLADDPPRIETIYNNFENDAFFLKALGLNGVCTEWCPSAPKFPSPKPYGVNYVGAVFKFQYTDLNGKVQVATGTQLPQSAYSALITPYTLFGLGRTSNYIEEFFFGVPLNSSHFNYWTGSTIPNSQVVAVPYKSDAPAGWTLELYITPSGLLFWIMIAMVLSLIILAIFVYVFYRREKKEDEQKKQEQAHLFSFDAL